jgi:hypothetical protein
MHSCPECAVSLNDALVLSEHGEIRDCSIVICGGCLTAIVFEDGQFRKLLPIERALLDPACVFAIEEARKEAAAFQARLQAQRPKVKRRPGILPDVNGLKVPCATCGLMIMLPSDVKVNLETTVHCVRGHERSVAACVLRAHADVCQAKETVES